MNRPHFLVLSGSRLYGTHREDSDYDYRGVYLEPIEELFGFQQSKNYERKEPDTAIYPLKSFLHLALQGNPNILEVLFAHRDYWMTNEMAHQFFYPFITLRHEFLSQRCRKTYGGYAYSQLKKVINKESPSKNTRQHLIEKNGYDTKYAAHTIRLLLQGIDILRWGDFNPTLDPTDLEDIKNILNGDLSLEEFTEEAKGWMSVLSDVVTALPERPDERRIEQVLIECYNIRESYEWAFENRRSI
jgi:predicted nucleotidyltransferase